MKNSRLTGSVVVGVFRTTETLTDAMNALEAEGFAREEISILLQEPDSHFEPENISSWLKDTGTLTIPGEGSFLAAGPIVSAMTEEGLGEGGEGISGALVKIGIADYDAKRYEDAVKAGGLLLAVHVEDFQLAPRVARMLQERDAEEVGSRLVGGTEVPAELEPHS